MALNLLSIYTSSEVARFPEEGGTRMLKALFTMILLSNDYVARVAERLQRVKVQA